MVHILIGTVKITHIKPKMGFPLKKSKPCSKKEVVFLFFFQGIRNRVCYVVSMTMSLFLKFVRV